MKKYALEIKTTATTIRVPDKMLEEIKNLAIDVGDSQNGTMLHLMYLGMKVYRSNLNITLE